MLCLFMVREVPVPTPTITRLSLLFYEDSARVCMGQSNRILLDESRDIVVGSDSSCGCRVVDKTFLSAILRDFLKERIL